MKWQEWRGFVVGIFASLGLIGSAGAGVARAAVASPEPSFELPTEVRTEEGVAHATLASPEPSFELPTEVRTDEGMARATVASPEPSFELPTEVRTEEGVAHATAASPSEQPFGLQPGQLAEKR